MKFNFNKLLLMSMMLIIGFLASIKPTYAIMSEAEWVPYNFYSNVWGMQTTITFPSGITRLSFTIPYSDYNLYDTGGVDSEIFFSGGTNTGSVLIYDLNTSEIARTYDIFLDDVDGLDFTGSTQIIIYVMQSFTSVPSQYYEYYNTNRYIEINKNAIEIIVIAGLTIHETLFAYLGRPIPTPSTAPTLSNLQFEYWALSNGTQYDFTYIPESVRIGVQEGIASGVISDSYFYVYGVYSRTDLGATIDDPTNNTPEGLGTVLAAFGLNNDAGKIFLYFLIMLFITIILVVSQLKTIVIMISDLLITIFFIYLGWIPIYASIIISLIFILIFMIATNRVGDVSE